MILLNTEKFCWLKDNSLILSIDTSTTVCSVALHDQGKILAATELNVEKSHSEQLIIIIQQLLKSVAIKMTDLKAVAIASGPGSYTGLRIGTSTAKGFCYTLEIPLLAVNTLEAMLYNVNMYMPEALFCPMLDARRMEVYCLIADAHKQILKPTEAVIVDESSFNDILSENPVVFFGNGSEKCKEVVGTKANVIFVDNITTSAKGVGEAAWKKFVNKEFEDVAYFEPFYLKEFKAIKPKPFKV